MQRYGRWQRAWGRVFWRKAAFNNLLFRLDALITAVELLGIRLTGRR